MQNADIAHFSCHGFFDFLNPEKSALILAGAKITPLNPPLVRGETREDFPLVMGETGEDFPLVSGEKREDFPLVSGETREDFPLLSGETREDFPLVSEETGGNETPPLARGAGGVPSEEKRYIRSRRGETFDIAECLTLTEIFDLQLSKCRLVALSACETALTDATDITDEYIGLTSGFFYAGATSVLSTLWAVNDVSTAILMIKFYELLGSESRPAVSVALRESQLWLRDLSVGDLLKWVAASELLSSAHKEKIQNRYRRGFKQDYQPYQSPMYWAPFCAVGQ
ncbi:hypothetical protein C7B67_19775 [filamentous cyanobacterium Phorm 6]|nr:hypothetical protein C7B67_19775 [filamentous cyanobacterium Phorm 6]